METAYTLSKNWKLGLWIPAAFFSLIIIRSIQLSIISGQKEWLIMACPIILIISWLVLTALRTKFLVSDYSIIKVSAFQKQEFLLNEISGYEYGHKGTIVIKNGARKTSGIQLIENKYFHGQDDLANWVKANINYLEKP